MIAHITARHFCAGAILDNGYVTDAAPIIRYMVGKRQEWIANYCRIKGWVLEWS